MNIIVLGGGMVGSAIARDLSKEEHFRITVVDSSARALERCRGYGLDILSDDCSNHLRLRTLVEKFDLVVGALPGFMGYDALKTVIEAGKNIVDISFFPEDPFTLDGLAKDHGVTAIVDCGLAPGLGNILAGRMNEEYDSLEPVLCYVGGLPAVRRKPYEYGAVFSPIDVIEEYTRPARYIENGAMVTRLALSDIELLDFEGIGTLEAFNSDGLRSLAVTMNAPNMKEKTMRYPGHAALMEVLRTTGFFSKEEINVNGTWLRPLDVTAKLLFPAWEMAEGEEDLSVMRVIIEGSKEGVKERRIFSLLDRYDRESATTSMARTTGYTAAVAARLVADGSYERKGISPPEYLGADPSAYEAMMAALRERNIGFTEQSERIGG